MLLWQVRVEARDGGTPARSLNQVLTVKVLRNLHAPRFTSGQFDVNILETHVVGQQVLKVEARDDDDKVVCDALLLQTYECTCICG